VHCTLTEVFLNLTEIFLTLTEVFPCFFLSCKANARVKLPKMGHVPHSSTLVCICVVRLLFVLFCVLFVCKCVLPRGDNPTAVNKYMVSYWRPRIQVPSRTRLPNGNDCTGGGVELSSEKTYSHFNLCCPSTVSQNRPWELAVIMSIKTNAEKEGNTGWGE
jgi:hypothetical protein